MCCSKPGRNCWHAIRTCLADIASGGTKQSMKTFRRFKESTSGSAAVTFGLAALPLIGFAGAALDYSRAASIRTDMQRAVDAAALALVRDAGQLSDAQLEKRGQAVFASLFRTGSRTAAEPIKVTRTSKTIRVAAAGSVQTTLLEIMGFKTIEIGTNVEVAWGNKKIELALVLDNTGSMGQTVNGMRKIEALQKASLKLLKTLSDASAETESIKVSIVPFNTQVRLNAAETGANPYWVSFTGGVSAANWTGYVEDRKQPYDANDAEPRIAQDDTLYPAVAPAYQPVDEVGAI